MCGFYSTGGTVHLSKNIFHLKISFEDETKSSNLPPIWEEVAGKSNSVHNWKLAIYQVNNYFISSLKWEIDVFFQAS